VKSNSRGGRPIRIDLAAEHKRALRAPYRRRLTNWWASGLTLAAQLLLV
jgi:hypothetical protein